MLYMVMFLWFAFRQPENVHAETYSWTAQDGSVSFTDDIAKVPEKYRPKQNVIKNEELEQIQDSSDEHAKVKGVTVVEFGVYSADSSGAYPAKTNSGEVELASNIELLERTSEVNAKLGTIIGMTYMINGTPPDSIVNITIKVISPTFYNPLKGKTSKVQSWVTQKKLNEKTYDLYKFEMPWELVPGTWIMQILYKGRILASHSFKVEL